jgi:hypothetical protein
VRKSFSKLRKTDAEATLFANSQLIPLLGKALPKILQKEKEPLSHNSLAIGQWMKR